MSISITYCGHSTIILGCQSAGKRIIIDPFLKDNPLCPSELKDPGPIDMICLTHGHADHASDAAPLAIKYGATVFATYELCSLLAKEGVPESQLQFMNNGGRVEQDGIAVSLTNAFHSNSFDAADGTTHYAGQAAGVVVEFETDRCLYHCGDTCLFGDMKLIGQQYQPEIMCVPIGDRFTMGPEDAAKAVRLVNPKIAIPIHYGTFPMLTGTPKQFTSLLGGSGAKELVLDVGETKVI